jgi:hypothetical protein
MTEGQVITGAVGAILFLLFSVRALIQPEEPWYKWGSPASILLLTVGGVASSPLLAIAGAVLVPPSFLLDRWWRLKNDANIFF